MTTEPPSPTNPDGPEDGEDPEADDTPEFADLPLPSLASLHEALAWAFEGEEVPPGYLERCAEHALIVQEGNRRMNLTKVVEPREIAAKHYLDCWRAARYLPLLGRSLLDLGSGGGYPGVPIALAEPNVRVVLLDSTQKKAEFLKESVARMQLKNVSAVGERAEDHLIKNHYDLVIVRAVSSVRENVRTLRKVRHSLRDFVMMKGPSWSREVRAGEREAERLGFKLDTVWEYKLPGELGDRAVLVYRAPGSQGR